MPYLHFFADQHCLNCGRTVDFHLLHAHSLAVLDGIGENKRWREHNTDFRGLFACGHCKSPVTLDFRLCGLTPVERHELKLDQISFGQASRFLNRLHPEIIYRQGSTQHYSAGMTFQSHEWGARLNKYFSILAHYPDSAVHTPSGIPKELESEFAEIREVAASPRYTVVACRRLLERACKLVLGENAPQNAKLVNLIDSTLNRKEMLSAITDWAHAIRAIGNEAVHDDASAPTPEEAKEALEFTSLLVELLFS